MYEFEEAQQNNTEIHKMKNKCGKSTFKAESLMRCDVHNSEVVVPFSHLIDSIHIGICLVC